MTLRARRRSQLATHPIILASFAVFFILSLALGYHTGARKAEAAHYPRLLRVRHERVAQERQLRDCHTRTQTLMSAVGRSDARVQALRNSLDALRRDQDEAEAAYTVTEEANVKCDAARVEVEERAATQSRHDAAIRGAVAELTKEVAALQVSIQHITEGEGMSIVLLQEVVQQLRVLYRTHCRAQPGCVELTDEELLAMGVEGNQSSEAAAAAFLLRDAEAQLLLAKPAAASSVDLAEVYLLPSVEVEADEQQRHVAPSFFGRSIDARPLLGLHHDDAVAVRNYAGTVVALLEVYEDYAMCAFHYANPHFSFQSLFLYTPADPALLPSSAPVPAQLHRLIVSPLLQYCVQCDAQVWRQQYRVACLRDRITDPRNYGGRAFWRVRSMIQAAPAVQRAALDYYQSRELETTSVLAVVLQVATEQDKNQCDTESTAQYGVHYQYLRANFGGDAVLHTHVSDDVYAQCSPTAAQIIDRVNAIRVSADPAIEKVYLSVPFEVRSNVLALLSADDAAGLLPLLLPAYALSEKEEAAAPGFTELVNHEIASRATDVLVSPFFGASRYVTEEFLLRHALRPQGRVRVF